jgi:hypothetical protein
MVYFFKTCDPKFILYMGLDKFENDELIRNLLPPDVWFHVSGLSSAHVYLRMPKDLSLADVPPAVIEDACQLVKENSLDGKKEARVRVVYTLASNLKKTKNADVGSVSFHDEKACVYVDNVERKPDIVNRIRKSRVEKETSIVVEMRDAWNKAEAKRKKKEAAEREVEIARVKKEREEERKLRSYEGVFDNVEDATTNADLRNRGVTATEFEDDFM